MYPNNDHVIDSGEDGVQVATPADIGQQTQRNADAVRANIEASALKHTMLQKGQLSPQDVQEAAALSDPQLAAQREHSAARLEAKRPAGSMDEAVYELQLALEKLAKQTGEAFTEFDQRIKQLENDKTKIKET